MILLVTTLRRQDPTPFPPIPLGILSDAQDMVDDVPVHLNIWTECGGEPIPHLDVEVAGAGAFVHSPAIIFDSNQW